MRTERVCLITSKVVSRSSPIWRIIASLCEVVCAATSYSPSHRIALHPHVRFTQQCLVSLDQNVISWNDFIEGVDNDSALSQMLRSVPGGGGPPLVRLVRGQGADGRWTEVSL